MSFLENYADRIIFVLCAAMIFIPLEQLLPRIRQQRVLRADLKLDLAYTLLGAIATMAVATVFVTIAVNALTGLIPEAARTFVSAQPIGLQVVLLIVLGDLYYYWAHRLFHTVPVLWRFHAIHHSIEEMDWIASNRTHPVDTGITNSGFIILAILFDFSAAATIIFSFQFSCHSLLKHSNVAVGWGPLRWLYVTPTFHHWHHANVAEAYDKNFAAQFPLWDILFGTAVMTEDHGPPQYGVDDPVPRTFLGSLLYPLRPQKAPKALPDGISENALALEPAAAD